MLVNYGQTHNLFGYAGIKHMKTNETRIQISDSKQGPPARVILQTYSIHNYYS